MSFSIYAQDNEFAVSTGSNVNSSPGRSKFDYPPNSTKDLVITTKAGDPEPRMFDIGDTYDITWGGNDGETITDATVIRSDAAPGNGGVVVFEGLDSNGNLSQVVWTPNFDLENWYWANFSGGNPPQFYTTDQQPDYTHGYICFAGDTLIAIPGGTRRADAIRAGDLVTTLDGGAQPVLWVGRRRAPGQGANMPVRFAPGTIGNTRALRLSPQHRVMVSGRGLRARFGVAEALAPAKAFVGLDGVNHAPCRAVLFVHFLLAAHQVLLAEDAPCESLYLGPMARGMLGAGTLPGGIVHQGPARPLLTFREARRVLSVPAQAKRVACL